MTILLDVGTAVAMPAGAPAPVIQIWMGGLFDTIIGGFPIYFWLLLFAVVAVMLLVFVGMMVWGMMRAVTGHFDAVRNGIPEALKITKNMQMKLVPAHYADQIFEWENPDEIERWHLTAPHSVGQLGPVNTAILVDYHDWVDNPMINESIKVAAEKWNEVNPEDQIHHYDKFMEYRKNGKLKALMPNGVEVPAYFWIDWSKQEQYLPEESDAASFGGWLRREAGKLKTGDNEEKKNYGTWILGGCVAIGALILIMSFIVGKSIGHY